MMSSGKRGADVALSEPAGERAEALELGDDDVPVLAEPLVATAGKEERLASNEGAVPLVDLRRDDQVDLAELVLEEHEDDPVRGRRTLPRDREAREGDARAVRRLPERVARQHPGRQVR